MEGSTAGRRSQPRSLRRVRPAVFFAALFVVLVLSGLTPTTRDVRALGVLHDVGNVDAQVTDNGRITRLDWNGVSQICMCPTGGTNELGLAIDQDNYDHAPNNGPGRDREGFFLADSFESDFSVDRPIYFTEDSPALQRSSVVFNHTGSDPFDVNAPRKEVDDLSIEQTAWTASGADWLIVEYQVTNRKAAPLTGLRFTLYGSYSATIGSTRGGVGGTAGDDLESWDPATDTYHVRDNNGAVGATTMAVSSADPARPLDRYVTRPMQVGARNQPQDDVLYEMVTVDPNGLGSGVTDGISAVLGWGVGGLTISAGGVEVFAIVFAFGTSVATANAARSNAQTFYRLQTTGLRITELSDSPSAQIEVWNERMGPVSLGLWSFESLSGPLTGTWSPALINTGEYAVFTPTVGTLGPEADTLFLWDNGALPAPIVRDTAAWGWLGPVPDPVGSESVQRVWDPLRSRYTSDWTRAPVPTFGAQNPAPRPDPAPIVVLNEVLFDPLGRDAFVELYYRGVTSVDLSNFVIVVDRPYAVPAGTTLTATRRWFVLREASFPANFGLSPAADNAYLYDAAGKFLDKVGWATPHGPDTSVVRAVDGNGTAEGYEEATDALAGWVFDAEPTMNLIGLQEPQTKGGNPGDVIEFFLNVTNFKADVDRIELFGSVDLGWPMDFLTALRTPLPDTGGAVGPDSGPLGQDGVFMFVVATTIPTEGLIGDEAFLTVNAQSGTDPMASAALTLNAEVFPHPEIWKGAAWDTFFTTTAGFQPDDNQITLLLEGRGMPQVNLLPQDVVFEVDNSGSMVSNDPAFLRWDAIQCYVDEMTLPDRGAIVAFGDNPATNDYVAWYDRSPLTNDYALLRNDTQDPNNRWNNGGTWMKEALQLGNAELIANGDGSHTWVEILLSDGVPNDPNIATELALAVAYGIRIYTIGLGPGVNEAFMRYIADTTGGEYYFADTADDLCAIYGNIGTFIVDIAASPIPGGTIPISERVPEPFDVIPGTINPPPQNFYIDPRTGDEVIEWQLTSPLYIGDLWWAIYDIECKVPGTWNETGYPLARIDYETWDGRIVRMEIPSLMLTCSPGIELQPPRDVRTRVTGSNVLVTWQPPAVTIGVDGYELFGSPTATGFDFLAPPLATVWGLNTLAWFDLGAAGTAGERYYLARSFNATLGTKSVTSNTAGKFTTFLAAGTRSVSLPLEPYDPLAAATFQAEIGASRVQALVGGSWVDATGMLQVGAGYLIERTLSGLHTYTGRPAAMIQYRDGWGFGTMTSAVESVSGSALGDEVSLTWDGALGPDLAEFIVYRSPTRLGFFDGSAVEVGRTATPAFVDPGVFTAMTEAYYMVVPVNATGAVGGAAYGLGFVRLSLPGHAAIGLPVLPLADHPVSWYAEDVPQALGILWFHGTTRVWVPHFRSMPAGVYDAAVSRAQGYQVTTQAPGTYTFVGR